MPLAETDPMITAIRAYARWLVETYVPCDTGDLKHDYIINAKRKNGVVLSTDFEPASKVSGTSCGYLCHWLLWKLGVLPKLNNQDLIGKKVVNRKVTGFEYKPGGNISRISGAGAPAFFDLRWAKNKMTKENKVRPRTGDIVLIGLLEDKLNPKTQKVERNIWNQLSEHVFVFRGEQSPNVWLTSETGQAKNQPADGQLKTRTIQWQTNSNSNWPPTITGGMLGRHIIGWLSLNAFDYGAPRDLAVDLNIFNPFASQVRETVLGVPVDPTIATQLMKAFSSTLLPGVPTPGF